MNKDHTAIILNYGVGNLFSIQHALTFVGWNTQILSSAEQLGPITAKQGPKLLVLPGVGAFRDAMKEIHRRKYSGLIEDHLHSGGSVLGICLGFQLLFNSSTEGGLNQGLGLVSGNVEKLPAKDKKGAINRIPHIGWTAVWGSQLRSREHPSGDIPTQETLGQIEMPLVSSTPQDYYFVHSYVPYNVPVHIPQATFDFGGDLFCAAVFLDQIIGVQFHPERSGPLGIKLLHSIKTRILQES